MRLACTVICTVLSIKPARDNAAGHGLDIPYVFMNIRIADDHIGIYGPHGGVPQWCPR